MMDYKTFLAKVIDDGIDAATKDYIEEKEKEQLEGAIAGFNACRNLLPEDLVELLKTASQYKNEAYFKQSDNYWFFVCYHSEVEWVINVVSAMLVNEGREPLLPYHPTVNGVKKAAEILNLSK